MAATGSLGRRAANMALSSCSVAAMAMVLPGRRGCWRVAAGRGVCGNSVVEGWEECDCGTDAALCRALCCVPSTGGGGATPCTRTQAAPCSPSEGLCCSSSCTFAPPSQVCAASTDCSAASTCSGASPICPRASALPDGGPCDGGARTCLDGACTGSPCQALGLLPCSTALTNHTGHACSPHCRDSAGRCLPATSLSFPEGEECRAGGGFGHCSAGACTLGAGAPGGWVVGVAACLVGWLVLAAVGLWCYCAYCRGGTLGPRPA